MKNIAEPGIALQKRRLSPRPGRPGRSGRNKFLQLSGIGGLVGTVFLLSMVLAGCSGEAAPPAGFNTMPGTATANTVSVNGTATVASPPDEAVVILTVENDSATAAAAMDATSVQSNLVLAKLKSLGIEEPAIQTSSVTLYPIRTYNPDTGKETLAGYRAQNSVRITLKEAPLVAKVLAAGVETGITLVSGPEWRLRDDSRAISEALKQAVAQARAKADTLAAAGGVAIGEVVNMSEGSVQVPAPVYRAGGAAMDASKAAEPAISAGTLDVTATVTITYALKR